MQRLGSWCRANRAIGSVMWAMRFAIPLVTFVTLVASTVLGAGCSKPKPPQLTPKQVTVTALDAVGFDMRVNMEVQNPNAFALAVQSVSARVVVDGAQDLGTITSAQPIALPANATTAIDVPMRVAWKSIGALATIATSRTPVPYTVEGKATIGGDRINIDVPFKLQGLITPEQAARAAAKSLQGIPGLPSLSPGPN